MSLIDDEARTHRAKSLTWPLRLTSAAAVVNLPLGGILFAQESPAPGMSGVEWAGFALLLTALGLYAGGVATNGLRPVLEPLASLDERERLERLQARARAFVAFAGLVVAGGVYMAFALKLGWPTPSQGSHWVSLATTAGFYLMMLPQLFFAWAAKPLA